MRATAYHFDSFRLIYGITVASVDSPQKNQALEPLSIHREGV